MIMRLDTHPYKSHVLLSCGLCRNWDISSYLSSYG